MLHDNRHDQDRAQANQPPRHGLETDAPPTGRAGTGSAVDTHIPREWKRDHLRQLEASKVSDDTVEVNQEAVNQDYEAAYSKEALWKKIAAAAILAGKKILLRVLMLYYCLQDPDTPPKAKAIIVAALGYFIVPLDAIIDFVPGGYADDLGVLAMAFAIVLIHIKAEHRQRANEKLALLLGEAGSDRSQDTPSTPGSND